MGHPSNPCRPSVPGWSSWRWWCLSRHRQKMVTSQLASLCKKGSVKIGLTTTTTTRMMMMMTTTTTSMATGTPSGFWLNENPIRTPSAQWIQVAQRTSRTSPCPSESPWSISAFASKVQPHFAPCGLPQEGFELVKKTLGLRQVEKMEKKHIRY